MDFFFSLLKISGTQNLAKYVFAGIVCT